MNKLTTEKLLFAHRIGATHCLMTPIISYYKSGGAGSPPVAYDEDEKRWISDLSRVPIIEPAWDSRTIDFTPLHDWIDHDGGECPVKDDDEVIVDFGDIHDGQPIFFISADSISWDDVERFKLHRAEADCPEQRSDAIEIPPPEYDPRDVAFKSEQPETTHSTAHHKRPDGTDLIDEWWKTYTPEIARILMWEQVKKYYGRLGKKDPIHIEVSKMADYLARWDKKERELAGIDDKQNTIV